MAIFYERTETEDGIIIRYKYWALTYILFIITFALVLIVGSRWALILIILFLILFIIDFWRPNQELRKAMKEGNVKVSGSKFSFSNPFTATIKKEK